MKSPLWFETSMLVLILVVAVVSVAFEKHAASRSSTGAAQTAQVQPERLSSR